MPTFRFRLAALLAAFVVSFAVQGAVPSAQKDPLPQQIDRLIAATPASDAEFLCRISARLSPNVGTFVRTFASPAGTAQSFDARMDQALFLANGPTVRSWLVDRPGSLVGRLAKLSGAALADELYLSVFTRLPDDEERRETAEFLARRPGAYADLAWALLASAEF